MKILSIPDNLNIANELLTYRASYRLKGNVLTVKRSLADKTPGSVCSPETVASFNKLAMKALQNAKAQVLYK